MPKCFDRGSKHGRLRANLGIHSHHRLHMRGMGRMGYLLAWMRCEYQPGDVGKELSVSFGSVLSRFILRALHSSSIVE